MSKPKIDRETTYDFEFYTVVVGTIKEGESEAYLVVNKETKVVEFTHEVLPFVLEWIKHFEQRLKDIRDGKTTTDEVANIVASMN